MSRSEGMELKAIELFQASAFAWSRIVWSDSTAPVMIRGNTLEGSTNPGTRNPLVKSEAICESGHRRIKTRAVMNASLREPEAMRADASNRLWILDSTGLSLLARATSVRRFSPLVIAVSRQFSDEQIAAYWRSNGMPEGTQKGCSSCTA